MNITFRESIRKVLREEMLEDDKVFLIGEDIGVYGGSFKVTEGLLEEFGPLRVIDTPISESGITGVACGAALVGMKPILEIMFGDFLTLCMDHLVNDIAKVSYSYGGKKPCPLVVRTCVGAGATQGPHHSQSFESWLVHVPGLKVVFPSSPRDAYGLLRSAIRDPNPVVFFEHKMLYSVRENFEEDSSFCIQIGKAEVKREGKDVTIVAIGAMVPKSLNAAAKMAEEGIFVEVIDPRTLLPLDVDTIIRSVRKTHKLLVVHEAPVIGGVGGEIVSSVLCKSDAFDFMDRQPMRLGGPFTPIPFSHPLEQAWIVKEEDIIEAIRKLCS